MQKFILTIGLIFCLTSFQAQTNPVITSFLQNSTETGSYYTSGNSTAIDNSILYNCQVVEYSNDFSYITTQGVPGYPTGPFLDGNPSQASGQNAIYKMPLNPIQETGTNSSTTGGNIGVFINGVSLFDYRDGVAWNSNTNALCGGPGNPSCPGGMAAQQDWNRDAIPAEMDGFDCSKGHPAMGNYHHHQNPSAFKWDLNVVSDICNLYDADGLYSIDASAHSPLIGYAYDGFPIYGAYGYQNENGSGGVTRIKSGYQLRNITVRTHHADGTDVDDGPAVSTTYFLGYFREDYEWVSHSGEEDYLDEHNGRVCVTPEYPSGTYAYFATVDNNWNSAYPYVVGPTFYGEYVNRKVNSISETTTIYTPSTCVTDLYIPGTISSGTYQVGGLITSDGEVGATEAVTFRANEIVLSIGFSTVLGADFIAEIDPCTAALVSNSSRNLKLKIPVSYFYDTVGDLIVLQVNGMLTQDLELGLYDSKGQLIQRLKINQGSTIQYIDTQTFYEGQYFLKMGTGNNLAPLTILRE